MAKKKARRTKQIIEKNVYTDKAQWTVQYGKLKRGKGNPGKTEHLFKVLGEKLPYAALAEVKKHVSKGKYEPQGVYVSHDSMGCPRYIGRGKVFARLKSRKKAQPLELQYFSFYLVSEKNMSARSRLC